MKLAIVIPWFGRDLKGGAEQQAWQMAWRLAARGHEVDVLTTCCRSHQDDWATNHLPAGSVNEPEGFAIRRFPVDPRDRQSFERVAGYLMTLDHSSLLAGVSPVSAADSAIFARELIKSAALLDYLEQKKRAYDWFILLPYLYGPVLDGVRIVGDRAALQPCLHDEAYAYLPETAEAFRTAGKLLFNSEGEKELALQLFGPGIWEKSTLVGEGVEIESKALTLGSNGSTPRTVPERYVLYLGRKESGKNVPLLVNAFRRFRAVRPNSSLRLLLAGHGTADLAPSDSPEAEDLGVVSEPRKGELLRYCRALFQPSTNESFSRTMMEAWMHGKPVGAHSACLATSVAVARSNGGWLAGSEEEWATLFVEVDRQPALALNELGENGRLYAERLADWERVMTAYESALEQRNDRSVAQIPFARKEVSQFLPNLSYGDAISNYAIWIRNELRSSGIKSEIYVRYVDPKVAHECAVFSPQVLGEIDGAIYHHSIGTEITPYLVAWEGPKCLVYHNITPPEFFEPFQPSYAEILRQGRDDLGKLAAHFTISCGDSTYNAQELREHGFAKPTVLPIPVSPYKWNLTPDCRLMKSLQDGRTNLLFVGRIAPNKKQDDLISAFNHYLDFDPDARLILAGKMEENDPYATYLQNLILELNLQDSVVLTGSIEDAQLAAYYRTADLFWSMSEHEGFCVPLVEAMWFDIPVFAYRSSAVPETLGDAALMFTSKDELRLLAATAHCLASSSDLRESVTQAQRKQRERFLPAVVREKLNRTLAPLAA